MTEEQWLRDALTASLPDPPANPSRAADSINRARKARHRTAVLVTACAALLVAGTVTSALMRTPEKITPSGESSRIGLLESDYCPDAPRNPRAPHFFDKPTPGNPSAVPAGATLARLCAGNGHLIDVPTDPLTESLPTLIDATNDLPHLGRGVGCTDDLGYGYRIMFGYPDGSGFMVSGALYGCGFVVVGADQRLGASDLLKKFADLLRHQRSDQQAPTLTSEVRNSVACEAPQQTPPVARPEDIVVGVLCVQAAGERLKAPIPNSDLAVLRDDLRRNVRRVAYPECTNTPEIRVVGLSAWGELVTLPSICGTSQLRIVEPFPTSTWPRSWLPETRARQILDDLQSKAR